MAKKTRHKFKSESELAQAVVDWLISDGWTVYKEVYLKLNGKIADIVAVKAESVWIVESKLIYGSKVLEQAFRLKDFCNFVSVAIPNSKHNLVLDFFIKHNRIGMFEVHSNGGNLNFPCYVYEKVKPEKNQNPKFRDHLLKSLNEGQKESIAGSKGGGYITPYKLTIDRIKEYLKSSGPQSISEIVKNVPHHYSNDRSAKGTLAKRLLTVETDFEFIKENGNKLFKLKSS